MLGHPSPRYYSPFYFLLFLFMVVLIFFFFAFCPVSPPVSCPVHFYWVRVIVFTF